MNLEQMNEILYGSMIRESEMQYDHYCQELDKALAEEERLFGVLESMTEQGQEQTDLYEMFEVALFNASNAVDRFKGLLGRR